MDRKTGLGALAPALALACTLGLAFTLAGAPALAQTLAEPLPGAIKPKPAPAGRSTAAARPCPEYGPGFVRVEGSRTCIRLSGSVAAEYGVGGRRGSLATGSGAGAVVQAETRTETGFGELRTVVRGRVQTHRGSETGPFR